MKKTLSIILFVLLCIILTMAVFCCVYSICDINQVLDGLAKDPGASGIDCFGIGWGYGICLFFISTLGLILTYIGKKRLQQRILQQVCIVAVVIYALLIATSFGLFYM